MNDKEEVVIFRQKSSSTDGEKTSGAAKDVYVPNQIMGFYMVIAAPIVLRIQRVSNKLYPLRYERAISKNSERYLGKTSPSFKFSRTYAAYTLP